MQKLEKTKLRWHVSRPDPDNAPLILGFGAEAGVPTQLHCKPPAHLGLAPSVSLVSFPFPAGPLRCQGSVSEGGCPELLQRRGRRLPVSHCYPQLHLFALLQLQGMLPACCTAVWKVTAGTVSVPGQAVAAHAPVQDVLRLGLWLHYCIQ